MVKSFKEKKGNEMINMDKANERDRSTKKQQNFHQMSSSNYPEGLKLAI